MTLPSCIFLVGLPGAGKSTVGKFIAKEINYTYVDLDHEIEKEEERSIVEIFKTEGEAYFREAERDQLRRITLVKTIVATGGGAPCFHSNMDWMNANGFTLFLNPPLETIIKRVSDQAHRPLIGDSPEESINNLLQKRITLYRQAGMESDRSEPCEILAELHNFFPD